jgi:hypothetical protein
MKRLAGLELQLTQKGNAQLPITQDRSQDRRRQAGSYTIPNNKNYCHTHGYIVADEHTSTTCNAKADGHKDTATRSNTMGGSTCNKHRVKDF